MDSYRRTPHQQTARGLGGGGDGTNNVINKNGKPNTGGGGAGGGRGGRRRGAGATSSWLQPERLPTEDEKTRMFAMAVVAGVMGVMDNHCYRFEQQTR